MSSYFNITSLSGAALTSDLMHGEMRLNCDDLHMQNLCLYCRQVFLTVYSHTFLNKNILK